MNGKPYQSLPDIPVSPRKIVLGIVIAFAAYSALATITMWSIPVYTSRFRWVSIQ